MHTCTVSDELIALQSSIAILIYFHQLFSSSSIKFFRPPNFFKLFEQFQKLVAFLLPIFRNVDGSWRVTSKLRGSTLIQVARRRLKVLQRFSASLVRVGDVQGVSRRHAVRGKKGHLNTKKSGKIQLRSTY